MSRKQIAPLSGGLLVVMASNPGVQCLIKKNVLPLVSGWVCYSYNSFIPLVMILYLGKMGG